LSALPDALSIAFVTGSLSRRAGGLFHSVRSLALALHDAGHSVTVVGLCDGDTAGDLSAWHPLRPIVAKPILSRALGYAPHVGRALPAGSFDVLHQHGIWQAFSMQVSAWRRRTGRPVMVSPRGMLDPWAISHRGWKKRVASRLYEEANLRGAACLHALNESEARAIRAAGFRNPIATIPNGVDLPGKAISAPPAWWPGGRVLLFIGRLHTKKGVADLIEAWALMQTAAPAVADAWRLVIGGWDDGGYEALLREAIARHGLVGSIVMPGPLYGAEKESSLRNAEAFILPSHSEGLPISVLEAWSYQLPVLMTEACNLPEGFGENAALRISTDPPNLARELAAALGLEPERLAEIGAAGHRLAADRFHWREIARRHVEVYRFMIGSGEGATPPSSVRNF
jgi:glycosyltransferase involved in cell wall biosynthesis